jgi:hypothetical protein
MKQTYARSTANFRQFGKLVGAHDPAQSEIGDHDVSVLLFGAEQEVFGLQVYKNAIFSENKNKSL